MGKLLISTIVKKYGENVDQLMALSERNQEYEEIGKFGLLFYICVWFSSILDDIGACTSLVRLDVSSNKLKNFGGSIYCYSLTCLNLCHNSITSIPQEIGLLENLVTLNILLNLL